MDIRPLNPDFAVSPQISTADIAQLVADGFTHVICNRPAYESAPEDQPDAIRSAVEAAGMSFSDNPLISGQLSMDHVAAQSAPAGAKTLAYCASGTRSAILWALSSAGHIGTDEILKAMEDAGYPMPALRGQIEMLASNRTTS